MSRFKLSPKAQADVEEIWDYSAAHWSVDQAEAFLRQMMAAIDLSQPVHGMANVATTSVKDIGSIPSDHMSYFIELPTTALRSYAFCISAWTSISIYNG